MNPLNDPGRHVIITCTSKEDFKALTKRMPNNTYLQYRTHVENKNEYYIEMTLPNNQTAVVFAKKLEYILAQKLHLGTVEITYRDNGDRGSKVHFS